MKYIAIFLGQKLANDNVCHVLLYHSIRKERTFNDKCNELDCTILEVEVSISGSRWRKISLPADQEQCGTDMQMFLAHMRQAARHAIWVENTLQAEHQWCFQRMPERAEMSEA